jgi:hypothetical protein
MYITAIHRFKHAKFVSLHARRPAIMKENPLNDNAEQRRDEPDITNRDMQTAYLWMKKRKDHLEKRKYDESIIFFVDGNGQIMGWTEMAARSFKYPHRTLPTKKLGDFLTITDGRSFKDIFPLVKPGFPYIIKVRSTDVSADTSVYAVKVTSLICEGKSLFYLVFYSPTED